MSEQNKVTAIEEFPQEIVTQGQGETGMTASQVKVLSTTLLKGLTPQEMGLVFHQAKEYGLSVFRKELWAYKDNRNNLVTIAGRDGLLKVAARNPNFGGLRSGAVYANDLCEIDLGAGTVTHKPKLTHKERGTLVGAWAAAYRKDFPPMVVYYTLEAVQRPTPVWAAKPAEMAMARAESAALRRADVGVGGLYLEDEIHAETVEAKPVDETKIQEEAAKAAEAVRAKRRAEKEATMPAVTDTTAPEPIWATVPAEAPLNYAHPEAEPKILASDKDIAEFVAKCGGEKWAKKHCLRTLGHDSLDLVADEDLGKMLATLDKNQAKEAQDPAEEIKAAWMNPALSTATIAQRSSPNALDRHCAFVTKRAGCRLSNLAPAEADQVFAATLERNATAPKK